jgi:hypothetical protein
MARKTTLGTRTQMPTFVADLASQERLDFDNFNSFSFSLILDEILQLEKRPVAYPIIHLPSSIDFSYSFKVFHHNFVSIKVGNNAFADVVVCPSHKPFLSSRQLLKKFPTGTSAFGLKNRTQMLELSLDLLDFGRIIKPVVRTDGKVVYSEVDAENSVLEVRAFNINLSRETKQEKTSTLFIRSQKAFTNFPTKIFFVTIRNVKSELLPCLEQPQTQRTAFETSTSGKIIPDTCLPDDWLGFCLLDNSTSLLDASNSKLGRQNFPKTFVNKRMESDIIFNLPIPRLTSTELKSFFICCDCSDYFRTCLDSYFCGCSNFHKTGEEQQIYKCYDWECPVERMSIIPKDKSLGILDTAL